MDGGLVLSGTLLKRKEQNENLCKSNADGRSFGR